MHFNRLRLVGFKSFVEPTELRIEPGLTGVVGPNGCGKSNLVEALRWVMGENSAKKMRGSAMDDVIFAGTANRPPRNLAEVSIELDNARRAAPAAYNDAERLEITRRIQRQQGSNYAINGREVRMRDVQLLFADMATGAHSTAIVSQGRIGSIINAKPIDRRSLLEEAAGITGLHSRRHEAELRLRAAEQNLERVEDLNGQLDQQLQGLKRQARQANRYRNISDHIRKAEAIVYHLKYAEAKAALDRAVEALKAAEAEVAERTTQAANAQTQEAEASLKLPPLRQAEAEQGARLHRLTVARDGLDAEARRSEEAKNQLEMRLAQITADAAREEALAHDAAEALARLEGEKQELTQAGEGQEERDRAASAQVDEGLGRVRSAQEALEALTKRAATEDANRNRLRHAIQDLRGRLDRLQNRLADAMGERDRLLAEDGGMADQEAAEERVRALEDHVAQARAALEAADAARAAADAAFAQARESLQSVKGEHGRLAAEEAGLARLLALNEDDLWPPLIDAVAVQSGWEIALGAALGDDLNFAADAAAPVHWQTLPPFDATHPLPEGLRPLSDYVQAPPVLARRLSQIAVVEDAEGERLRAQLKPGQRLVARSGALWRWDGFTVRAGAPTAASVRLEQRNRLADLRQQREALEERLAQADRALADAKSALDDANQHQIAARQAVQQAERDLNDARSQQAAAIQKAAARASRLAALGEAIEQAERDRTDHAERLAADEAALAAIPPSDEAQGLIAQARQTLNADQQSLAEARSALDALRREAMMRSQRLTALERERQSWSARAEGARGQIAALGERHAETEAALAEAREKPHQIAQQRAALEEQIALAEQDRSRAAASLAEAEAELAAAARTARAESQALADAREHWVRAQADQEHGQAMIEDLAQRIREALECEPDAVLQAGGVEEGEELPDLGSIEARLERLKKERDGMGPVNLRAEIEAQEVEDRLNELLTEKNDLVAAIEKLREGIASLNKEGRERLLDAFKKVDEHFQKLFVQVFGGGKAHLQMTESEDPLEAGLEIMASPPGKRLQVMSLLSGGEQALTALALLFAVFLTNPAPICVLDEVDAPLDDANVERMCDLLDGIAKQSDTRFLIVTHNPITMARMDRLFGVTMMERGISTLVSVDLAAAEALRQTA